MQRSQFLISEPFTNHSPSGRFFRFSLHIGASMGTHLTLVVVLFHGLSLLSKSSNPTVASSIVQFSIEDSRTASTPATSIAQPSQRKTIDRSPKITQDSPPAETSRSASVNQAFSESATGAISIGARLSYLANFRRWIESKKHYPPQARTLGHEGRAEVRFTLLADGSIVEAQILKSSGSDFLDQAALALFTQCGSFEPIPESLAVSRLDLVLPLEYELN